MIVVTGGAGFIGSNLVASLDEQNRRPIVVCDRFGCDDKWRNIAKHEVAEIVDPAALIPFLERYRTQMQIVYHLGAISATTETDVDLIVETNLRFSLELYRWCATNGVRYIYASSAATYGDGSRGFDDDGSIDALRTLRPLNAYGWSKHLFDRQVARLLADGAPSPPQCVGLKFFNVYGPNEYHKGDMKSIVAKLYPKAAAGEEAVLFRSHHPDYEDGGQMRDFIYVKDCVDVMTWLGDRADVNGLFNVGTGRACSFKDFVTALFEAAGQTPRIRYVDTPASIRDKYQYFTQANMQRLRDAGYDAPFRPVKDGVADYVRNHLSHADPYR